MPGHLLCLGFGFCARALAADLLPKGWKVTGSARSSDSFDDIRSMGAAPVVLNEETPLDESVWQDVTHLLISAPPGTAGDPVLRHHKNKIVSSKGQLSWIGYLSTTGVYGNRDGAWVDEGSALKPTSDRARRRVEAERQWLALFHDNALPVHIFRLAGIYGPGRNQLVSLKTGKARRIEKPGQMFSRIHVEDVATILQASIDRPAPGAIYNVCDDEAAAPADVVAFAADLLDMPPPPLVRLEDADMSEMGKSFYNDNKRVRNSKIKKDLGISFAYPSYREGLRKELERL